MANRAFQKTLASLNLNLTFLQFQFASAGSSISALKGSGVTSVTRIATGQYQVNLDDSYNRILGATANLRDASDTPILLTTGLTNSSAFVITTVGTDVLDSVVFTSSSGSGIQQSVIGGVTVQNNWYTSDTDAMLIMAATIKAAAALPANTAGALSTMVCASGSGAIVATINGYAVSYTWASSDALSVAGLVAAINADATMQAQGVSAYSIAATTRGFVFGPAGMSVVYSGTGLTAVAAMPSQFASGSLRGFGITVPAPSAGALTVNALPGSGLSSAAAGTGYTVAHAVFVAGSTIAAQWQAVGLPVGVVPAVGVSFVSNTAGAQASASATAAAGAPLPSGLVLETLGDPNLTLKASPAYLLIGLSSGDATPAFADAPSGSTVNVHLFLRNSSVTGKGE